MTSEEIREHLGFSLGTEAYGRRTCGGQVARHGARCSVVLDTWVVWRPGSRHQLDGLAMVRPSAVTYGSGN
jgi:hypothetical protein